MIRGASAGHTSRHFLFLASFLSVIGFSKSTIHTSSSLESIKSNMVINEKNHPLRQKQDSRIKIVFSDVDGTLVHYPPDKQDTYADGQVPSSLVELPPSSTGLRGIISKKTLQQCEEIRARGVKLILVSGMRTTTLLKRIPYLPKADAYVSENGGRIFYPTQGTEFQCYQFHPSDNLNHTASFSLQEDVEWYRKIATVAGVRSYIGNRVPREKVEHLVEVDERDGLLWDYGRKLTRKGIVLDITGYSSCFRVNRAQQRNVNVFQALLSDPTIPDGLSSSENLGCIDFYPSQSGKKNCCVYLARKFIADNEDSLSQSCVCLCDDDNDLEMAVSTLHAYIPNISSESMRRQIELQPSQFTVTDSKGNGIEGTERSLDAILGKLNEDHSSSLSP